MAPHPEASTQPKFFWNRACPEDEHLWRNPKVHPYRADWFAHATESAEPGSAAHHLAHTHPEHAFALLCKHYERFEGSIAPALRHSAQYSYQLLEWARANNVKLGRRAASLRSTVLQDGHWGWNYARSLGPKRLSDRMQEWAADNRHENGSAAVLFLLRHPREPIQPYQEQLRSQLASSYPHLPDLSPRGFILGASDTDDPKWAYHLALSRFTCNNGNYLPALRRDPVWLVGYLLARPQKIPPAEIQATAARLKDEHPKHPLLPRALTVLGGGPAPAIPPVLASGQQAELSALERLQRSKNREVYRPSEEQMESVEFKEIVGPPRYTERGYAKGTVMDVADGEFAEIKSGSSVLEPTYQLRLQAFHAKAENRQLRIYTNRPVSPEFTAKLSALGVTIEPMPQ